MSKSGGLLYAIAAEGTSLVKIGSTTGPIEARVRQLQTGQPFPLRVIATLHVEEDVRKTEAILHVFLTQERRLGEWFEMTLEPQEFPALVARAMAFGSAQDAQDQAEMSPEKRALLDTFGERVKAIRLEMKLTQQELADLMHAPRTWVSDLENAGQRGIAAETVVRFAKALGVSTDYLLGLTNDPATREGRPAGVVRLFGRWKGQLPPDWDAHFDDLDEEITRLFEGEENDSAAAR